MSEPNEGWRRTCCSSLRLGPNPLGVPYLALLLMVWRLMVVFLLLKKAADLLLAIPSTVFACSSAAT